MTYLMDPQVQNDHVDALREASQEQEVSFELLDHWPAMLPLKFIYAQED